MAEKKNLTQTEAADAASVVQASTESDTPTVTLSEAQLAALVEKQVAETLSRVNSSRSDVDALGKSIAMNTAKLAGKKTIDPEIIHAREKTWAEMEVAIEDARERGQKPQYKLQTGKTMFLPAGLGPDGRSRGSMLIDAQYQDSVTRRIEDTIFAWAGIPNEIMIPLNAPAKKIHGLFMKAVAYNPNEPIAHAVNAPDAEFIQGGLSPQAQPEVGFPMGAPPIGGGVEILSGQTGSARAVPVLGMS